MEVPLSACTATSNSGSLALGVGVSELLSTHLNLKDILQQPKRDGPVHGNEQDVYWWRIPPGHFSSWCCNRHGTLHGGLCLALFFALYKAHVKLSCGERNENKDLCFSNVRVHTQYMRPIFTATPLVVRTVMGGVGDFDIPWATVELFALEQQPQKPADSTNAKTLLCRATITTLKMSKKRSCL